MSVRTSKQLYKTTPEFLYRSSLLKSPKRLPTGLKYDKGNQMITGKISNPREWNMNITPHFKYREFRSLDKSNEMRIHFPLVKSLEILREKIGHKPIHIDEGFRSPLLNNLFYGPAFLTAKNNQHPHGRASTIHVNGMRSSELSRIAASLRDSHNRRLFKGIITSEKSPHVQVDTWRKFGNRHGTFQSGAKPLSYLRGLARKL